MRTLFGKVLLFIELLATLNANQEAMPVNIAQKIYETTVIEEIAEAKEEMYSESYETGYELDADIRLTWLDDNTCIKEYIVIINGEDMIGIDSIVDIDKYGSVDEETYFRWFIGDESYADSWTWEDNVELIYGLDF